MADHKSWLWKKKSIEKTIIADEKVDLSPKRNEDERHLTDIAELERDLKISNDRLSLALSDCNTKDGIVKQHAKMAQEAIAGWEKAEAEAQSLNQELEEVLQQRVAGEERLSHLDSALKECMQQLRFVREEQEHRIHDALMNASKEFEKTKTFLEENLAETNRRLTKLGAENTQLSKTVLEKEKLIGGLNEHKTRVEADFNAFMSRLESTEKENGSLRYEVRVLEKELEIRNEEREFSRRTADVAHKQHLESSKKIAKLESECQRLRVLVRKRLPGPAALTKMRNEVELLGSGPVETRRRKSNSSLTSSMDFIVDNGPITPNKRMTFLTEQLCAVEEENRILKETLYKNTNELQLSRIMHSRTVSKLSQVESQLEESSKTETSRNTPTQHELSVASMSDIGSDDKVSCAESWASALISELDHFKNGKQPGTPSSKNVGASEMNLMDDFVEMEKLAIVDEKSEKKINRRVPSNLSESICKIIKLIEGVSFPSLDYGSRETLLNRGGNFYPNKNSETPTGYVVRVLQWKTSELGSVLQQFVQTCNDLLNGKEDMEKFAQELTSALDWIMNHCFSLQDVSSMRDAIKKHLDWDESRSESEIESGIIRQFSESDISRIPKEQLLFQVEELQPNVKEDGEKSKDELANTESAKKDLEGRLQSEIHKSESLLIRLQESEKTIETLRTELETLKQSKRVVEEQVNDHKLVNEELDKQLTIARVELSDARQKFSTHETELESKHNRCEELEATCIDLQLQLESVTKKEVVAYDMDREENELRADWEITAASEKLAECQETILNLGKQLKALASPNTTALIDKAVSNPTETRTMIPSPRKSNPRFSLLDKMLAEDNGEVGDLKSPTTKEVICTSDPPKSQTLLDSYSGSFLNFNGISNKRDDASGRSLAIVPTKKKGGGGLLKKLLWRKKRGNSKKTPLLCAA